MAKVTPPLHTIKAMSPGQYTELGVLEQLARDLPETYELFHSVNWTQVQPTADRHGEIDIIVLNQSGDLALLEVKAGELKFTDQGMFKEYGGNLRNVSKQVQWQFNGIQQRLRAAGLDVRLMHFLVLPDASVATEAATIGFPRERLLDSSDCQNLAGMILSRLGSGQPGDLRGRVHAFLMDRLQSKVEVAALAGRLLPLASSFSPAARSVSFCASTRVSSVRLTWRPLRATSVLPRLWLSSSSSTISGRKTSCS